MVNKETMNMTFVHVTKICLSVLNTTGMTSGHDVDPGEGGQSLGY